MLLSRVAGFAVVRRRLVLVLTTVFLALAGALGGGVAAELSGGGFDDPDAESVQAARVLETQFGSGAPTMVLLVRAPDGVDSPAAVEAGTELTRRLAKEPGVVQVASWWTAGRPDSLKARDGSSAVVLARLTGGDEDAVTRVEELAPTYRGEFQGVEVEVGGQTTAFSEVSHAHQERATGQAEHGERPRGETSGPPSSWTATRRPPATTDERSRTAHSRTCLLVRCSRRG